MKYFKYNTKTMKWTNVTSVPLDGTIKYYNYAVVVYGKDLLYFGGRHSGNSIFKYQLNTDTWKVTVETTKNISQSISPYFKIFKAFSPT